MGDFFRGWRRRFGLVTLLMACVSLSVAGCQSNSQQPSTEKSSSQVVNETTFFPATAQTSGVFTVWTDPEEIVRNESFRVVVAIRLPEEVKRYTADDLSGKIKGSDNYLQKVVFESADEIPITNGYAEIRILVPGAENGTSTEITIQSKVLGQTATFNF